jgi:hypothetical protein
MAVVRAVVWIGVHGMPVRTNGNADATKVKTGQSKKTRDAIFAAMSREEFNQGVTVTLN